MRIQPTDFTLRDLRIAMLSIQQSLRVVQGIPPELLNNSKIPLVDTAQYIGIDEAIDLLEAEVTAIRVGLQNHRARSSAIREVECV